MRVAQEEIFGPVLTVIPFKTKPMPSGWPTMSAMGWLAMSGPAIWAVATGSRMRWSVGMTWINSHNVRDLAHAVWRIKTQRSSGVKEITTAWSLYTEIKAIHMAIGNHAIPKFGIAAGKCAQEAHVPINTDWLKPEFNIIRLAHVELLVTDLRVRKARFMSIRSG